MHHVSYTNYSNIELDSTASKIIYSFKYFIELPIFIYPFRKWMKELLLGKKKIKEWKVKSYVYTRIWKKMNDFAAWKVFHE